MPLTQMFVAISSPCSTRPGRHDLSELLTVAACAVLCSADEFSDIEAWAKEGIDWLRGVLCLSTVSLPTTRLDASLLRSIHASSKPSFGAGPGS
jgi:hypothetical protein